MRVDGPAERDGLETRAGFEDAWESQVVREMAISEYGDVELEDFGEGAAVGVVADGVVEAGELRLGDFVEQVVSK